MSPTKIKYSKLLGQQSTKSKVAKTIAVVATALSVAIIIISTIVADGFRREIENSAVKLLDYAHIKDINQIFASSISVSLDGDQQQQINDFISPQQLTANIETQGVIQHRVNIIPSSLVAQIGDTIAEGEIVISQAAARLLDAQIGDELDVYSLEEDDPTMTTLTVAATYTTNIVDMEVLIAKISEHDARLMTAMDNTEVSYYAIKDPFEIEPLADYLAYEGLDLETVESRAPHIYGWLTMIDNNMSLVLIIMIIVAFINVITSTLIVMLDSTKTVAMLRALGMNRGAVSRIFLFGVGRYALLGMVCGVVVAVGLGCVQGFFGIIELDAAAYFVDRVPIAFNLLKICSYMLLMGVAITLSLLIPINIVSRLNIALALKYQ